MEWLIGILLLIVGIVIGFFVARFINVEDKKTEQAPKKETVKEIMAQHSNSHILETKKIAHLLEQQTIALNQQIAAFEMVSNADSNGSEGSSLNYFGEHASVYLRNKGAKQNRTKSSAEFQPLDFSSHSSGLFSGDEASKVSGKE